MVRYPIADNKLYSGNFEKLEQEIKDCFFHKQGPGDLPTKRTSKKVYGIMVPSDSYINSGQCMAWAYKELSEAKFPERYIILGTNHSKIGYSLATLKDEWVTPLGKVIPDISFIQQLKAANFIKENDIPYKQEHSIEIQLPFLQFVSRQYLPSLKIVPILAYNLDYEDVKKAAKNLIDINKDIAIITSANLTHFGPEYDYVPFRYNIKEELFKIDNEALEFIKKFDAEGFINYVNKNKINIYGVSAIAVMIETCKLLGATKVKLLSYYTSGDLVNDYKNSVGYAALVFE